MSLLKGIGITNQASGTPSGDRRRKREAAYLSPVRRIDRVAARERICAMTFDDGPCRLPANPDNYRGKPLTLVLAELLERYGAKGTFCIVGDTSAGYPDKAGRLGSLVWGGVAYDHFPDFQQDDQGGLAHCPELVARLLAGGHEIANHTYSHTLFGWPPLAYGRRKSQRGLEQVVADLRKLHTAMEQGWGYPIRLSRPPHLVDAIRGGFTSYDAYAIMGYQYLGYSLEGGGRKALANYTTEVDAAWRPLERLLLEDPDALRGQILLQKDGFNSARRSPVADGLDRQLQLLSDHGYQVVTVSELLERAPFRDVTADSGVGRAARRLLAMGWCPAYQDNTVHPGAVLTRGELAMMAYGWETVQRRIALVRSARAPFRDMAHRHPYAAAATQAVDIGAMDAPGGRFRPDDPVTPEDLIRFCSVRLGRTPLEEDWDTLTHEAFFTLITPLLDK